ncbi:MAG: RdgB/HAM1 family non-canonical purine NTP pyrophosphatase [Candidatus Marinimicrobia bacterium]|nr:RdgB/HAM1 family non-canonical purine NTP pyrophosphatase [Candidatus Neomarinimicrobiota bacterium]
MKNNTIVIATHNKNKLSEMKFILKPLGMNIKSLFDFPEVGDIPETGNSLEENALIKAKTVYKLTGFSALSDDTGLEVDALNGEPGVYSARWAGENCSYSDNVNKLISKIKLISVYRRNAQFRTVMAFVNKNVEHTEEGIIKGLILDTAKGVGGFGYDPVFYIPMKRKTFAEMSLDEKGKISHRGLALNNMLTYLKTNFV